MFPVSVDPRAKIKVTALQLPRVKSLAVSRSWRRSRAMSSEGRGLAAARPARAAVSKALRRKLTRQMGWDK
jgi:hypothetical protein